MLAEGRAGGRDDWRMVGQAAHGRSDGRSDGRTVGRTVEQTHRQSDRRSDGQTNGRSVLRDGRADRRTDGRAVKRMDGRTVLGIAPSAVRSTHMGAATVALGIASCAKSRQHWKTCWQGSMKDNKPAKIIMTCTH
jgi:hypothetical protein